MLTVKRKLLVLTGYYWLILLAFLAFVVSFALYVHAEKAIDHANDNRHLSLMLTHELRQSSEDLTRMVRTYVATSDAGYKRHYEEILAIRDGRANRPVDYQNVYWDLVLEDDRRPEPAQPGKPLLQRMRDAGFTEEEMNLLSQAKAHSDALTRTERQAISLMENGQGDMESRRRQAITILHDRAYHHAKAAIMAPIAATERQVEARTGKAVSDAEAYALRMRYLFIAFGLLQMPLLWGLRRNVREVLGGTVSQLHGAIEKLGRGEFSAEDDAEGGGPANRNSVLSWVVETRRKLAQLDRQRHEADRANHRLTALYTALSQSNQAIVHSKSELELFQRVCEAAVRYGGMKMAWVGMCDELGGVIEPLCAYGEGTDYVGSLRLLTEEGSPLSHGPTGRAFIEGHPVWCQDFLHDPLTAPWHERGAQYGWGSSAALALKRDGRSIGTLTLYSSECNAFDEPARKLIEEMAMDLNYALDSFQRQREAQGAALALQRSEQRLRTIIETEPECIKVVSAEGALLEMNAAGMAMLEADSLEQIQTRGLLAFIDPAYHQAFIDLNQQVMTGKSGTLEFEVTGLRGSRRWLETHAAPMRGENGQISMTLAITRDITLRKQNEKRIQYLAHYDVLTGLPNRTMLAEQAAKALDEAGAAGRQPAFIFLDIDHFKDINDSLGHRVGDALLVQLAERLKAAAPAGSLLGRLGGDEFTLLLPDANAESAATAAGELLRLIGQPYQVEAYNLSLSGSMGIALYPKDGRDLDTLTRRADAAMYQAKRAGRDCYQFFTAAIQHQAERRLVLLNALRGALEQQQMALHFQPQIRIADGALIGVEALLRWHHPDLGAVSPAEFIPAAEESGLILPIGEWVLREAVRQAIRWRRQGIELVMAVNLSAVQLRQADLPDRVVRILAEEDLPASALELELTEGAAMSDPQQAIEALNALHAHGVRVSIDDFGTGYSSLSLLRQFKVGKLKIDQSFVRDISVDADDHAIVAAIIHMAESLGLSAIAEGVETEEQCRLLSELGCGEGQGYLFGKPMSAAAFSNWIAERKRGQKNAP
ncbi:EAL domain-containing protein [uncultured Aquitalea sp.]|uniref:putative bifunctional diguanylate cyclase/phosphodiesterase n=1 Tax=uncultured Aquitalea sp. TaxID=540272 RepID=UPI0025FD19DE|nr:EAL domain-containing protein [uncultured Aquitalea sp.]